MACFVIFAPWSAVIVKQQWALLSLRCKNHLLSCKTHFWVPRVERLTPKECLGVHINVNDNNNWHKTETLFSCVSGLKSRRHQQMKVIGILKDPFCVCVCTQYPEGPVACTAEYRLLSTVWRSVRRPDSQGTSGALHSPPWHSLERPGQGGFLTHAHLSFHMCKQHHNWNYPSPPLGGAVGIRKTGVVKVRRQACRHVQWRKQTQAFHCHRSDRIPLTHLPGKKCGYAAGVHSQLE